MSPVRDSAQRYLELRHIMANSYANLARARQVLTAATDAKP